MLPVLRRLSGVCSGDTVVDVGSGGGFDSFVASRAVGTEGHVVGVDMTPEMLRRSRAVAAEMGVHLHITSGPALERAGDLAAILTNIDERDVLRVSLRYDAPSRKYDDFDSLCGDVAGALHDLRSRAVKLLVVQVSMCIDEHGDFPEADITDAQRLIPTALFYGIAGPSR